MTNQTDRHDDDYVNGRAAEEVQADRARGHGSTVRGEQHRPDSSPATPGLTERIGRLIGRLSGRSRTVRQPVVATVAVALLALTGCSSADDPVEQTDAEPAAASDDGATSSTEEVTAGPPTGTVTCTDSVDDGVVVDQQAADAYDGDAYASDTVEVRLELTEDALNVRHQENEDKIDRQPAGPLRFELHLAALDGSATNVIRAHAPSPTEINVEVGADEASLAPIDGGSPRFGAAGSLMMSIDRDLLPAVEGPFGFAFVETMEGNGTADVCPDEASIEDPLADADALQPFTE